MAKFGTFGKLATLVVYFGIYSANVAQGYSDTGDGHADLDVKSLEIPETLHRRPSRPARTPTPTTQEKINMCGPRLRDAIEKTCRHSRQPYFSPDLYSRQLDNSYPKNTPEMPEDLNLNPGSLFTRQKRATEPERFMFSRLSRSVIEECCTKPCSPSVLIKYCKEPKGIAPTTDATITAPRPKIVNESRMRRPRKETTPNRKQQRKRNRVRINVQEDSPLDRISDRQILSAVECLLDVNCIANRKLNVPPPENELATNRDSNETNSSSCGDSPNGKYNRKRGRSSRRRKLDAPSYLLPLLIRIMGNGLRSQSGWQEAIPVRPVGLGSSAEQIFPAGDTPDPENKIGDGRFPNLGLYQRKLPFSQKISSPVSSDEIKRDGQWDRDFSLEDFRSPTYSGEGTTNSNSKSGNNLPEVSTPRRDSYRMRIQPVTDAPLLSYFALSLGTNDGINYEHK